MIDLQRFFTQVGGTKYDVGMKGVLASLLKQLEQKPLNKSLSVTWDPYPTERLDASAKLSQDYLWTVCLPINVEWMSVDSYRQSRSFSVLATLLWARQERRVSSVSDCSRHC